MECMYERNFARELLEYLNESGLSEEDCEVWKTVLPHAPTSLTSYMFALLTDDPALVHPATSVLRCKLEHAHGTVPLSSVSDCERRELKAMLQY